VATVHGLQRKARSDATLRGLGGDGGLEGLIANLTRPERPHSAAPLRLVSAAAPKSAARFPLGCTGRELDAKGRLKPHLKTGSLSVLLGWQPGVLDTVIVDGYMTLSQRPEQIGVSGGRCGARVGFTVIASGVERISLRPAHLFQLDATPGDELMLAPIPDRGALVIVNPMVLAGFAPPHVLGLLGAESAVTLAEATDPRTHLVPHLIPKGAVQ
jgi:hypothetical protein